MNCPNCGNIMFYERIPVNEDISDNSGTYLLPTWKCVPCAVILDPVILRNRQKCKAEIKPAA